MSAPDSGAALPVPALPETLLVDRVLGRFGVGVGELTAPQGVAVDARGRILVADTGNHRVARFDSSGVYLDQFGGFGSDDGRFDRPIDVATAGTLGIWVLDRGNERIVKYDFEGLLIGTVVDLRNEAVRLRLGTVEPGGFAVDRSGQITLADLAEDRLIEFDPLGAILRVRGFFGDRPGSFADPTGVAVDPRGGALVGDSGNRRVQRLDAFGSVVRTFTMAPGFGGAAGYAVALGADSSWAVADRATGRLAVFAASGAPLALHVPRDKRDLWAAGLAFDVAGRLLVADAKHHRVVRLLRRARSAGAP